MSHDDDWVSCTRCKHIVQGSGCCYCGNEHQTDDELKKYVYAGFSCNLFEKKRIEFIPQEKLDGNVDSVSITKV